MNLFYLRYFVTLAHIKHYTKAAEELCISQPSLSHAITQMERELGFPLFEKKGRNTTLTRLGEEFLICAENTLSTLDAGIASVQKYAKGEGLIRLGLLRPLGIDFIPRLASEFIKKNSNLDVQFTFHTGVTQNLLDGLNSRRFDLIFCSQPPEKLKLNVIPIQRQKLVLITPKDHPLACKDTAALLETLPYPQIFFDKSSGIRSVIDNMFLSIKAEPQIAYETEEDQVIAGLVAQGFGIAVVPYMDLLLKLEVHILQISDPVYDRTIYMVNDEQVYMPLAVKNFRQFVMEHTTMEIDGRL